MTSADPTSTIILIVKNVIAILLELKKYQAIPLVDVELV